MSPGRTSSTPSRASSSSTSSPWRTPSRRTSGRSSRCTATRSSWSSKPRATGTRQSRSRAGIMLFVGRSFIISVRHGAISDLHPVRLEIEKRPDLLGCGPGAVLHGIVDRVVDDYAPVLAGIEDDIEELEDEIFSPARTNPTERIYKLKREVLEMHRATAPLIGPLDELTRGRFEIVHEDLRDYFRDVSDHALHANEIVEGHRDLLNGILDANP